METAVRESLKRHPMRINIGAAEEVPGQLGLSQGSFTG
jgi:hypothetical protein